MGLFDDKTKDELEVIAEKEEAEAKAARKAADAAEAKAAKKSTKKESGTGTPGVAAHPRNGRRGGADRRFW